MTYREAIQIQIKAMQEIYDNAEGLRDVAGDHNEKDAYNHIRKNMPGMWHRLQAIDDKLTPMQAEYKLKGNYSVMVNSETIN